MPSVTFEVNYAGRPVIERSSGSAWMAPVLPGAPSLPVRIAFQTRWFGWATMYLTGATDRPERAETPDVVPRSPQN